MGIPQKGEWAPHHRIPAIPSSIRPLASRDTRGNQLHVVSLRPVPCERGNHIEHAADFDFVSF
jgi:hypothetical protein